MSGKKTKKNPFEKTFVSQVLGEKGLKAYKDAFIVKGAGKEGRSFSWPILNLVGYEESIYENPVNNDKNTFIHELYHQIQYDDEGLSAFSELIDEYFLNEQMKTKGSLIGYDWVPADNFIGMKRVTIYDGKTEEWYVYKYDKDLSKYNTIKDLPFYEAQAQFVGDYAALYFKLRFDYYDPCDKDKYQDQLKEMSRIMRNSGYGETEAVRWIENDMK